MGIRRLFRRRGSDWGLDVGVDAGKESEGATYVCALLLACAKGAFVQSGGVTGSGCGKPWNGWIYWLTCRWISEKYLSNIILSELGKVETDKGDESSFGGDVLWHESWAFVCVVLKNN